MDPSALLRGLDGDQLLAVTSGAAPLAVIAPAGSGKTRVLSTRVAHRIAIGEADPSHVVCVTFTRRAADELRDRLRGIGVRDHVETGTFHAIALRLLRDRWAAQGRSMPRLIDRTRPFLREQLGLTAPAELAELGNEIAWARARLVRPESYPAAARAAGRRTRRSSAWVGEQFAAYEQAKARRHVVDFDDLLAACTSAIHGDEQFGDALRWRFRHFFVDEFQDVNPLQFALLEAWRGDRWDVFVVGDPHQSIYGWNGSDPALLDDLASRWPALETIHLDRTHRSTPEITAAAGAVIRAAELPDRLPTSAAPAGPAPQCRSHDDEIGEIQAIARAIRRRRDPATGWRSFAVLARTQDQVVDLDRGLAALGIPTSVRRQAGLLDAPPVRRVLGRLRHDDRPLAAALAAALGEEVDDPDVGVLADAADTQAREDPGCSGATFAAWAYANLSDDDADRDAVVVTTIHSAKGLEWPIVHVAGCEDGWIPIASARRRSDRDEEARLLYVACTRASSELTVHWARSRTVGGTRRERQRSPFLAGFDEAGIDAAAAADTVGRPDLRGLRAQLRSSPRVADPVLQSLLAWRSNQARAARTRPDAVLADETLEAIAVLRPDTASALEGVPGLGLSRRLRYGDDLLDAVRRARSDH